MQAESETGVELVLPLLGFIIQMGVIFAVVGLVLAIGSYLRLEF